MNRARTFACLHLLLWLALAIVPFTLMATLFLYPFRGGILWGNWRPADLERRELIQQRLSGDRCYIYKVTPDDGSPIRNGTGCEVERHFDQTSAWSIQWTRTAPPSLLWSKQDKFVGRGYFLDRKVDPVFFDTIVHAGIAPPKPWLRQSFWAIFSFCLLTGLGVISALGCVACGTSICCAPEEGDVSRDAVRYAQDDKACLYNLWSALGVLAIPAALSMAIFMAIQGAGSPLLGSWKEGTCLMTKSLAPPKSGLQYFSVKLWRSEEEVDVTSSLRGYQPSDAEVNEETDIPVEDHDYEEAVSCLRTVPEMFLVERRLDQESVAHSLAGWYRAAIDKKSYNLPPAYLCDRAHRDERGWMVKHYTQAPYKCHYAESHGQLIVSDGYAVTHQIYVFSCLIPSLAALVLMAASLCCIPLPRLCCIPLPSSSS